MEQKHKHRRINAVSGLQLTVWVIIILPGVAMHYFLSMNQFINKASYYILIGVFMGMLVSITNAINVMNNKPYKRLRFFILGDREKKDVG
ncbi:MAG: hypothetical protein K9I94_04325 [Bacteroidales bacterium]|nr:hypothetical protein [Bacteroidales bacterium]